MIEQNRGVVPTCADQQHRQASTLDDAGPGHVSTDQISRVLRLTAASTARRSPQWRTNAPHHPCKLSIPPPSGCALLFHSMLGQRDDASRRLGQQCGAIGVRFSGTRNRTADMSACASGHDRGKTTAMAQPAASCERCDAVCCRLTVVVQPEDRVPSHLTMIDDRGVEQMARGEDGWCVAIDAARMCCSIYEQRPSVCRRFAMDGPYCRDIRNEYRRNGERDIPLLVE